VRILLKELYGLEPELETLPIGAAASDTDADAVLLIGDRAMRPQPGRFVEVRDLGDWWCRWAELPFVFAMWTARSGRELAGLDAALSEARDLGLQSLDEIARRESAALGMSATECLSYLRDNLYFYLGPREARGLEHFYRLASRLKLAPQGVELGLPDCHSVE
jgi:chorismate dehydratase